MPADDPKNPAAATAAEAEDERIPRPTDEELPSVLEALLYATTVPLTVKRLAMLTGDTPEEIVAAALADLKVRHEKPNSGLTVMEVAGGWQMATRREVADWVLALHKHRRKNPISPAVMETLAIVAYKQPLVRAEIEAIRGVDCGGVLRALLDAGLVEVLGQKEVAGRPSLYGTTELFQKTFGLRTLEDLPSLGDLQKILGAKMKGAEDGAAPATDGQQLQLLDAQAEAPPAAEPAS